MTVALPANDREDEEMEGASDGLAQSIGLQRLHRLAELNSGLTIDDGEQWDVIENDSTKALGLATVLVVDDEPDMRRYLVSMLRDEYRVFQAADGIDGLRLAQEIMPDAMILDLMLPNLDGLEVCRQLKQSQQTRGIKIILLTARVDEEAKLTALKNGADDFVTKPFSRIEVLSRLANLNETARLERDLEQSNEQLKSALNNLKQTQAQLVQSEKLNALGALAAGLLHEINNPLNYSLTALQLVRADPLVKSNELLGEVCGDIDEGMQRIRTIVSDLRAFAYPSEADKRSRFEFAEALESAQRFTAHELKDVRIVTDLPRRATVLGSKTHVTQVLVNLLLNSVKAIRGVEEDVDGWIRVTAVVRDDRLVVTVGDNGVGMDENTLQHIFDPFFTTRDVGEGMGLGLSICHTIVTNHGGTIVARSTLGKGSELVFDLPLSDESQVDTSATRQGSAKREAVSPRQA